MARRKWKFYIETDGGSGYLDPTGVIVRDKAAITDFIGRDNEAYIEADRRANSYEELTGLFCTQITYESQGKVEPIPKTGEQLKMI